ncbi:MAG TPA: hypothetical protein P5050_02675 [Bacteroidia bacterium]|nr:hypothetical protein [Bacteroidia bacterium]HRS58105.1 hypothetical protein [Bacteroidia bacterium]HRU66874.1 hypothetical protein [Bacteroidia bacterium]
MKKLILLAFLVMLVSVSNTEAKDKKNKSNEANTEMKFKQTIIQKIKYPTFASEQKLEGDVFVSFEVNKDGRINVLQSNSTNLQLETYVIEKLNELNYPFEDVTEAKIYNMKFSFRLY